MKKILIASFLFGFSLCGVSFAEEPSPSVGLCSLKIVEHNVGLEWSVQKKSLIVIDSPATQAQKFLLELWERDRPLFKNAEMNSFGPDAGYHEIDFACGDQKIIARSWHRLAEENPKFVAASYGIVSLDGRTREEVLLGDEKWYLDFRKAFDDIYNQATRYQK